MKVEAMKIHAWKSSDQFHLKARAAISRSAIIALLITPIWLTTSVSLALPSSGAKIISIYDGDTVTLSNQNKIRLLQIDTPELRPLECYGNESRQALIKILSRPGKLVLRGDQNLDDKDSYGRLLRYIYVGKINVNLRMVKIGAAAPYFYRGERGRYAEKLYKAAKKAKANGLGLWSECVGTFLNPDRALDTFYKTERFPSNPKKPSGNCDPNYSGCIPAYPPDLNCDDIRSLGLAPVKVIGKDLHRLDRDGDGIGCT
jgi:endonuclease YncB( thermonuclease family)